MKFLPFKILLLCMLLPPILYILSVEAVQKVYVDNYLKRRFTKEVQNISVGDTRPLFEGSVRLEEVIRRNVDTYLRHREFVRTLGIRVRIAVITKQGTIVYPPFFEFRRDLITPDPVQVAADNLKLMNEGLVMKVDLTLGYTALLSFIMLMVYIALSLFLLYHYYRTGSKRARQEESEKNKEIGRLIDLEKAHTDELNLLERNRKELLADFERIKRTLEKEKARAIKNEDEMVEEIIALEEKIQKNLSLQDEQKTEIEALKEKIRFFEQKGKRKESTGKKEPMLQKRFRTLYKNVIVHERAISGFTNLDEEQKIKGEEVIHLLNEDPSLVTIKRKVFGKKGRQTILEVVFAYKGRLYFRKTRDGKIEILAIGTKNSQVKDLEFLNNL